MAAFSDTTTTRLEGYARARGLEIGVLKDRQNSAGVYFVSVLRGKALPRWISLGWNRRDAQDAIERLAADVPPTRSATGYVSHA